MALFNRKEKIIKECLSCHKEFKVLPSRNRKKFCSLKCSGLYQLGKKKIGNYKANKGSFKEGQQAWNKGTKTSTTIRKKMSQAKLLNPVRYWAGKKRNNISRTNNCNWKGVRAGYNPKHSFVARHRGSAKKYQCALCSEQAEEWSNKDHKYSRNLYDYWPLCKKCHVEYDKKFKIKKYEN